MTGFWLIVVWVLLGIVAYLMVVLATGYILAQLGKTPEIAPRPYDADRHGVAGGRVGK